MSPIKKRLPKISEVLRTKPRKYQIEGMKFLYKNNGRAIIGDDMGLGKTIQALGWLAVVQEFPAVVVCPANGKWSWERQVKEHTKMKAVVLSGQKTYKIPRAQIYIINYHIFHHWKEVLEKLCPKTMIIDECDNIKNLKAKRTACILELAKRCEIPHIIPMSGTPMRSAPVELYPSLFLVRPKEYRSFWKYVYRYCDPKPAWRGKGMDFTGAKNLKELGERISPYFLRRIKSEVEKELPPKQRSILPVDITNRSEYETAKRDFVKWYKGNKGNAKTAKAMTKNKMLEKLIRLGQLRGLAARGKLSTVMDWVDRFLKETDRKLLVFCYHKKMFNALWENYKDIAMKGKSKGSKGAAEIDKFQNDPKTRLAILSIKADGACSTLTAASDVLFTELAWTPAALKQAEDRVHRIGQKADSVNIYYMIARNTVEEHIWEVLGEKEEIIEEILAGRSSRTSVQSVVADYITSKMTGE